MVLRSWLELVHCVSLRWAQADSLSEQRTRYQEIKTAWDTKDTAQVEELLPTLEIILLYPIVNIAKLPAILMLVSLRLW